MKTRIFTGILCLFAIALMSAQDASAKHSNVGLKGGYNLAAVNFDGDGETGQRHSFHIGLYGESFVTEAFSIQPELVYSQQGYELSDDGGRYKQILNYINLPIMLKVYPSEGFFMEAGPQIGLAITHKEEFDGGFTLFDTSQEFEPNSFDWGVNFGAGFKTDTGVTLGVRYHLGLGDVYDEGKPQNRVWQFSLGFDF